MEFANNLLDRLSYHRSTHSSQNIIDNLKKISPTLNETNYLTLAYLSLHAMTNEERDVYKKCLEEAIKNN